MLHENIDAQTAKGIKELRNRIKVPSSVVDEKINIATWNIRAFGKKKRDKASIHYIAEVLSNFDLIAITELAENLNDLKRVIDVLGPYWKVVFSDIAMDRGGNSERIGYLYDKRVVTFTGLAAEADPFRKKNKKTGEYEPEITWWRSPYLASFRAGRFDFVLLTAHIRWGKGAIDRYDPLLQLAEWVEKRRKSKHVVDKDIIVMGDFNIPNEKSPLYDAITTYNLQMPKSLLGKHGTNLAKKKRYDQILYYKRHTKNINDEGGVVDFYKKDFRKLYPKKKFPDMDKESFTYEMSDHLPLWIQLDIWTDDEELDQLIRKKS
ncbi:endonuclease [Nitrosopumilus oxyclinae]|uniref:Endonuclease n=1 Tax=Nitrosopumilus oxyclinae TaxID=1959104 RepID=A0A7D5R981_9ARCH|nr:endonuclease/exonuclease/phosphatase family protein [Nitrosopumilus oxyclinae]QLH05424.1 endonuclease [Nitrosopumilus oxyclinae]